MERIQGVEDLEFMKEIGKVSLIFILSAVIFNLPLFKKLHFLSCEDWSYFLPLHEVTRDSILKYHIFPLWQDLTGLYHYYTDYPHFHNPETGIITPFIIPVLIFGETVGVKIAWTLKMIFGMGGMYLVSRHFNGKGVHNYLPPIVFMFPGWFAMHFTVGHVSWATAVVWLPWVFYFYVRSKERTIYACRRPDP